LLGGFLIFYVGRPARPRRVRRPAVAAQESPLPDMDESPAKSKAAPKPRGRAPAPPAKQRPPQPDNNPFDFS
jgi:hypothetical protein